VFVLAKCFARRISHVREMTVLAGAFKRRRVSRPFADVKKSTWCGCFNGKQIEIPFNYRDVLKGDNCRAEHQAGAGDTIVIPVKG